MMTSKDVLQILSHGVTEKQVKTQLENFENGFDYLSINRAAVVGDGIMALDQDQIQCLINSYELISKSKKIVKFVPASGAATRMFKELFEFVNEGKESKSARDVIDNIQKFAFAELLSGKEGKELIEGIISDPLNYGTKPKALILFHKYNNGSRRTAAEEHLCEGAVYAIGKGKVSIHFTVSQEHREGFDELFSKVLKGHEKRYGIAYDITFSTQKSSTDTIAVTPDSKPFRNSDGTLLFRPAGHGALIENLNDIDADLIFIKTVDNVAPDRLKADTITYKKALGGLLLSIQREVFDLLKKLDKDTSEDLIGKCIKFIGNRLCYKLPPTIKTKSKEQQIEIIRSVLNRPIRVCGMVKNEGEPGGGPFWTNAGDGSQSLQIAESSQIAPSQMVLMQKATHFNPVDLVCGVVDYKGKKFDLTAFVDKKAGFISEKSKDGRALKAQELPGLWNGAMAFWNTIFVEVPITTFSPVKVVTDLLREQHQ